MKQPARLHRFWRPWRAEGRTLAALAAGASALACGGATAPNSPAHAAAPNNHAVESDARPRHDIATTAEIGGLDEREAERDATRLLRGQFGLDDLL